MIRSATPDDAAACLDIYRPAVVDGVASFELTPPTEAEFAARIEKALENWAWLVFEHEGRVVGYAYGGAHRARAAYRWTTEVSVYLAPEHQGRGIGRRLYEALFPILSNRGFATALAGITLPNDPSIALHRALGFTPIGIFHRVGWKFGRWHDTSWWERSLKTGRPRLLFVCVENSNRSQMAEAFARQLGAGRIEAFSAGSRPSGEINPRAIAAMAELGYDLTSHRSRSVEDIPPGWYDAVITMGCGDACPWVPAGRREDWALPDPRAMGPAEFNAVRDEIGRRVATLITDLSSPDS